jgi:heat shock protein HtpX
MQNNLEIQKSKNIRRTWSLMTIVALLIIGLGWLLAEKTGNPNMIGGFALIGIVFNLVSFWFSDKIALSMNGAKPASPTEYPHLHEMIDRIALKTNIPKPKVYIIVDSAPNAFATGRNKDHAAVAVTTGILALLSDEELEGVLCHEFAHIQNRDILINTIVVVLVGFLSIIAQMFMFSRQSDDREGGSSLMFLGFIFALITPLIGSLIQLAISRKREFLADATGALTHGHPEHLARALEKISGATRPMVHKNTATAHMFIANPFGRVGALFATHPPVKERVDALLGREKNGGFR